jgi:glycosyltransferase involved in cell wall biosynthesis
MNRSSTPLLLFVVTEDWYFWSHRRLLAKAALNQGFRVAIATRVTAHADQILSAGFELFPIPFDRGSLNPLKAMRVIYCLARLYRRLRPAILHHVALIPIVYGGAAAAVARTPAVVSAVTGLGTVFVSPGLKMALIRRILIPLLSFNLKRSGTRVIFQNADDRDQLIRLGVAAARNSIVIPGSGIDMNAFKVQPLSDQPAVALASRMLWAKGIGEFFAAAQRIRRSYPHVRFLLAGAPDPGNSESISLSTLQAWQATGAIEYLGWRDDIATLFESAWVVCLPSHYGEGVPQVLIEAAACGRAVVTTDISGCRDAIVDGQTGILVPPRDEHALAAAIESLIRNPKRCEVMGNAGRNYVKDKFSDTQVTEQTLAEYRELMHAVYGDF